jgi:iron(III) transport system substrate-binding protein
MTAVKPMRALALAVALLLPIASAGCSNRRDALTIYSGRTEALIRPLLERFNRDTGIAIDVKYGDSADLALQINEEGERTPADVFLSQSPGATGYLVTKNLVATLPESALFKVSEPFKSRTGRWVGTTARQRVLVYNTDLVEPEQLPASVFELTEPRFAGKVAVAPTNGSFQDFVSAMRQQVGDERTRDWLTALAAGSAPTYANNNAIVEAVGRGEVPMGLVNHYYNFQFHAENPNLPTRNHVFPDGDLGSIAIPSAVTILAGSDKQEDGAKLVEFLLAADAQRYFSEETFEYPLADGVQPQPGLPALDLAKLPKIDIDELGAELESTLQLLRASGLERG